MTRAGLSHLGLPGTDATIIDELAQASDTNPIMRVLADAALLDLDRYATGAGLLYSRVGTTLMLAAPSDQRLAEAIDAVAAAAINAGARLTDVTTQYIDEEKALASIGIDPWVTRPSDEPTGKADRILYVGRARVASLAHGCAHPPTSGPAWRWTSWNSSAHSWSSKPVMALLRRRKLRPEHGVVEAEAGGVWLGAYGKKSSSTPTRPPASDPSPVPCPDTRGRGADTSPTPCKCWRAPSPNPTTSGAGSPGDDLHQRLRHRRQ